VKTSRDEAVDDFAKRNEWPPAEIDHDCNGEEWATNAIEFIELNVGSTASVFLKPVASLLFEWCHVMPAVNYNAMTDSCGPWVCEIGRRSSSGG